MQGMVAVGGWKIISNPAQKRMDDCCVEAVQRFRLHTSYPHHTIAVTAAVPLKTASGTSNKKVTAFCVKNVWFLFCLFGLLAHSYMTTKSYMDYETATETVIEMPTQVKPPSTSVCFPLWDLAFEYLLPKSSHCFVHLLTNRSRITACANELLNHTLVCDVLYDLTADPVDSIVNFAIKRPSKSGNDWVNRTAVTRKTSDIVRGPEAYLPGYVYSFYKGPYKCIRFTSVPIDSKTLSIDRMTTGYPRCKYQIPISSNIFAQHT